MLMLNQGACIYEASAETSVFYLSPVNSRLGNTHPLLSERSPSKQQIRPGRSKLSFITPASSPFVWKEGVSSALKPRGYLLNLTCRFASRAHNYHEPPGWVQRGGCNFFCVLLLLAAQHIKSLHQVSTGSVSLSAFNMLGMHVKRCICLIAVWEFWSRVVWGTSPYLQRMDGGCF